MTDDAITLDVSLLGREFRVACKKDEQTNLLDAVAYVDRKMREIRDASKVVSTERLAVMAALNIAHELLHAKSGLSFDSDDFKRRMAAMQVAIERVMLKQDNLF